jgi:hypothetical protein
MTYAITAPVEHFDIFLFKIHSIKQTLPLCICNTQSKAEFYNFFVVLHISCLAGAHFILRLFWGTHHNPPWKKKI